MTATVHQVELGRQGFGAMRLRPSPPGEPDRDPARVIDAVLDAGVRMVDTADAYGNEELVGRSIAARRDEVTLASKFGLQWRDGVAGEFTVRADPAYVRQACEASLRRLGTDWIDLYYLHHRSDTTPIEETVGAMAELVDAGKVRALGLSNVTADDLRRAHAVHPIAALQESWSLADRSVEAGLVPLARELGVAIVAHSPAAHGTLHHPGSPTAAARPATVLDDVARRLGTAPGDVALAWVHERQAVHGHRVVPLPGTTRVSHAEANVKAAKLRLSAGDLDRLDGAYPAGRADVDIG